MNKFNWQLGSEKISLSIQLISISSNIIIKNGMTEIVTSTTTSILLIIHRIRLKMQMVEFGQLTSLKSVSDPEE